jgi:hypothetical protein
MEFLLLAALYRTATASPVIERAELAIHLGSWGAPALLALCAAAGALTVAGVGRVLRPAPAEGQRWCATRRDLRGIRIRITGAGLFISALVITPPPGPLASQLDGAAIRLTARGRRLPGFRLDDEPPCHAEVRRPR